MPGIFWTVLIFVFACSLHEFRLLSMVDGLGLGLGLGLEEAGMEMVPVVEAGKLEMMNESRRKLGSFQICSLCTCCGGATRNYCVPTPCCYAINCNIPNRPFGFCSFTPKTCNCLGCHI